MNDADLNVVSAGNSISERTLFRACFKIVSNGREKRQIYLIPHEILNVLYFICPTQFSFR